MPAADFKNIVQKLYVAYFGRPADPIGMESATTSLNNSTSTPFVSTEQFVNSYATNATVKALMDGFGTSAESSALYSGNATAFVTSVYLNVLGRATDIAGLTYWAAEISSGRLNNAKAALAILAAAEKVGGSDAATVTNKLAIANSFTTDIASTTAKINSYTGNAAAATARTMLNGVTSATNTATFAVSTTVTALTSSTANTGTTLTLTSATNALTGGSGNDSFMADRVNEGGIANVQTLNANDTLDGSTGTDTLVATIGTSVTPASLKDIEIISVSNAAAANLTLTNANAVTTIKTGGNTNAIVFDGLATVLSGGLEITNLNNNVTVTTAATALSGAADELTVKLQSVTGGTLSVDPASGTNAYETITINSTGSVANTLTQVDDGAATTLATLKVTGDKDLTITNSLAAEVKTVSAVGFTGKLNVTHTNAAVLNITGGSGNDTFTLAGTFVGAENATVANRDTINGGDGTDTLSITSAVAVAATATAQTTVSNVEVIKISDASAGNVDLTKFTGANTLSFGNATVGAHTYTLSNANTVEFVTAAAGNNARTFSVGGTSTADTLTFKVVAATDLGNAAQTISGVETLTINTGTSAGAAAVVGGALTMTASAGGTAKIVATGVNQLTLTGAVTANEIDASGLTGNALLSMGAAAAGAIKVTGTGKDDAIQGSSGNDVLTGGLGADTITVGAGNDTIDLTEATASVV